MVTAAVDDDVSDNDSCSDAGVRKADKSKTWLSQPEHPSLSLSILPTARNLFSSNSARMVLYGVDHVYQDLLSPSEVCGA